MQFLSLIGIRRREVLGLTEIVFQIIEFKAPVLEVFHQLPITHLDEADRCRAPEPVAGAEVARKVLEDGVAFQRRRLAEHQREEAFAVEGLTWLRGAREFK